MTLEQLHLLVEVVQHGSFAAAARERGQTPSTASRAIAALEAELGCRLLHRTTRRLSLTEAGERYLAQIRPLLVGLDDAARAATDTGLALRGTVRATVPASFALRCIVPHVDELHRRHPAIDLDLLVTDRRVDLVADRVDLGIRLGRLADPDLVARKLFPMRYHLVAAPAYLARRGAPEHPSDLVAHDCLVFPLPAVGPVWRFRDEGGLHEVTVTGPVTASNTLALRALAIDGLGLTVLPGWLVDDALATGALVDVLPGLRVTLSTFDAAAWLVLPARRYVPARVRAVADFLAEVLAR